MSTATPVWFAMCGHWTSDWAKLRANGLRPLCPIDGSPGFRCVASTWWEDVDRWEKQGHPGYRAKVEALELP